MKRKVVVKASLDSPRARCNAISLAVQVYGVLSASIDRNECQLTVIGEGIDAVALIQVLHNGGHNGKLQVKILGCVQPHRRVRDAHLVRVEDIKEGEKEEEKKPEEKKVEKPGKGDADHCPEQCFTYPYWNAFPPVIQVVDYTEPDGCRLC